MTRELQSIVLILVGIVTLRISWGTTYLNYVKESMRPWLLVSGSVLVILGVLALIDALRSRPDGGLRDDAHAHAHGHGGPRSAWMLLLPVLTIFLIAPPALGAYAAARDTTNSVATNGSAAVRTFPPLPPGDPLEMYLSDYVTRAVWEKGGSLAGRTVELTGFVLSMPDGSWQLARLQLACCAADAFASKVQPVDLPEGAGALPENTWVTVTGEWVPGGGTDSDVAIPLVKVHSLIVIEQPTNPYD